MDAHNVLNLSSGVFELVEFYLDRTLESGEVRRGIYGVNVEKVREVVRMPKINPLASRHKVVAGIFELRNVPIPAVDLARVLGDEKSRSTAQQQIVVTEFSQKRAGFIVACTNRIRRVSWDKVLPPASDTKSCISGMTLIEDQEFLFILDLERILIDIEFADQQTVQEPYGHTHPHTSPLNPHLPHPGLTFPGQPAPGPGQHFAPDPTALSGKGHSVLIVDDSPIILKNLRNILGRAGFKITSASNGLEAQELLREHMPESPDGPAHFKAVITDVEMPRMDGLSLTKWIREQDAYENTPVILHTSLSGQNTQEAGMMVGANGYVVKNNAKQLLELLKEVIGS